jgi:hypothetical protein
MLQKETSTAVVSRLVAAFLCLALYLTGQFQSGMLHQLEHSQVNAVVHSVAVEADACHRNIFHHDQQHGCQHPTHLTAPDRHCFQCECLLVQVYFFLPSFPISLSNLRANAGFTVVPLADQPLPRLRRSRGPPLVC